MMKIYARQFRTAYRHRHGYVCRTRYARRFESIFQQIRASQQQVHAIVRSIEIIVVSYVFRCKQFVWLGNMSTTAYADFRWVDNMTVLCPALNIAERRACMKLVWLLGDASRGCLIISLERAVGCDGCARSSLYFIAIKIFYRKVIWCCILSRTDDAYASVQKCVLRERELHFPGRNNFGGSSGMDRTPAMTTRKRKLVVPEPTTSTPSAAGARESPSFASPLRAVLNEIQQLREEQKRAQRDFAEALRQCDSEIQQLRQSGGFIDQISPSENINFSGGVRDRVAHSRTDGGDAGARARALECDMPRDTFCADVIKLKPDTFDGSVPWNEFLVQFELIARANRWSNDAKTAILVSCLRGKARVVLESVQNLESLSFDELKSRLELHFGETHSSQNYYSQFTNRRQKFGEEIASFGSDLERLARLAYPECSQTIRDKIACAQFVSALFDRFVSRNLQLEGVTSLREAIVRAKTIKSIQESDFEQRKRRINFENKDRNRSDFNRDVKDYKKNFNNNFKGKFKQNKFAENENSKKKEIEKRKECWECGKEGHFRSECPGRQENRE